MKLARTNFPRTLVLAVLSAALLAAGAARADEYGDVNQLLRSGKHAEALAKADQYLAGKPKDPQMRFLRGVVLTEAGRTNEAVSTFQKLTEDFPELPEPYNNLAVLYAGQAQFDKARAALEMAIRTNPSYATAHENLGDVYAKLASQAYSRALQLDASNTAVQPKLGLIRELFNPGSRAAATARPGIAVAAAPAAAPAAATPAAPPPAPARSAPAAAAAPSAPAAAPAAAAPARAPAAAVVAAAPAAAPAPAPAPAPAARPAAVAPAPAATPAPLPAAAAGAASGKDVEAAVHAWAAAWAAKDMAGYLGAYDREFDPPGSQSRQAWEADRRARIVGKSRISVNISELSVSVKGNKATARFRQAYSADSLNITSRKTLDLVKNGDRWTIVREGTGA